jgi:hypothetical protein
MSFFRITPLPGIGRASAGTFDNLNAERGWADAERARLPAGSLINSLLNWGTANGYASGLRNEEENGRTGSSVPGSTMAQEVGHSLGMWWHTFDGCTNPDGTVNDGMRFYPRCNAAIGTETGFKTTPYTIPPLDSSPFETGIHPIPPSTSSGNTVDYMSYTFTPNWTSPFTYCQLMRALGHAACPAGVEGGGTGRRARTRSAPAKGEPDQFRFLYLSGTVGRKGVATIDPVEEILRAQDVTSYTPGNTYRLVITRQDGTATEVGFQVMNSHHDRKRPGHFAMTIPFDGQASEVALFKGKTKIASRTASPSPPTVSILSPQGGETLSGPQKIMWQGSDKDGDPLLYSVEYSPDAGQTWLPVAARTDATSATVDFDALPGSSGALLRVSVTDGLNTTEAVMAATFQVPQKPPVVTITTPPPKTVLTKGQVLVAQGEAYDYEDGVIADMSAYVWLLDGKEVGTGPWLVLPSVSGQHTLTLQVKDSTGQVGEASVTISGSR